MPFPRCSPSNLQALMDSELVFFNIIGRLSVLRYVKQCWIFCMGVFLTPLPSINETYIALIPKKANALCVFDYRPNSLCSVMYKIIAKVFVNRLKLVLPTIISQHQSAFVPGRLITDNVLIAFEALHSMSTRMRGKKGFMVVKVDMRKAYDRVEWLFLEAMMRTMGFEETWINLIMTLCEECLLLCVSEWETFWNNYAFKGLEAR